MKVLILAVCMTTVVRLGESELALSQPTPPAYGVISGIVLDEHDAPVEGVELTADDSEGAAHIGRFPSAISDSDGRFTLTSVRAGTVTLYTAKQSAGYVDTRWAIEFDRPDLLPTVSVAAGEHAQDVVVRIGPAVGVVRIAVVDADGKPLPARVQVIRPDHPEYFLMTGANERGELVLAMPPVAFTLEVSHLGYATWISDDDVQQVPDGHVFVLPGDTLPIRVTLARLGGDAAAGPTATRLRSQGRVGPNFSSATRSGADVPSLGRESGWRRDRAIGRTEVRPYDHRSALAGPDKEAPEDPAAKAP